MRSYGIGAAGKLGAIPSRSTKSACIVNRRWLGGADLTLVASEKILALPYLACSSMAERPPVKREDAGSSPAVPANLKDKEDVQREAFSSHLSGGISSVGRTSPLQGGCARFESAILHQICLH